VALTAFALGGGMMSRSLKKFEAPATHAAAGVIGHYLGQLGRKFAKTGSFSLVAGGFGMLPSPGAGERSLSYRQTQMGAPYADPIASALNTETGGTVTTAEGTASVAAAPRELSGPDAINPNIAVTSLDFQNLPDVSRIVIGLKGTERFTATRPQANLIVIDVPDAFMPQSLGRILDATQFISPVSTVRAYRSSQGTRVAIKLRENAEYRTQMGPNGLLYVDVVVPESMRRARETAEQSWSSVAPSHAKQSRETARGSRPFFDLFPTFFSFLPSQCN
jgi:hypothetical protein